MSGNRKLVVAAILSASLAVMISSGIRSSFGLFLTPITETLGTGRENLSIAFAVNNLALGLPLIGLFSDRIGPRRVVLAGSFLYAIGLVLVTFVTTTLGLLLSFGVLVGMALSATTPLDEPGLGRQPGVVAVVGFGHGFNHRNGRGR